MSKRPTNLYLDEKHVEWAKDNHINLSAMVREKLDEEISD